MGWDFIFKSLALWLGFHVMDVALAALDPSALVSDAIRLTYSLGVLVFVGVSMVSAIKFIIRGLPTSH